MTKTFFNSRTSRPKGTAIKDTTVKRVEIAHLLITQSLSPRNARTFFRFAPDLAG
jgi:hypothetical protein